jgi:hypothetical protein
VYRQPSSQTGRADGCRHSNQASCCLQAGWLTCGGDKVGGGHGAAVALLQAAQDGLNEAIGRGADGIVPGSQTGGGWEVGQWSASWRRDAARVAT